MSLLSPQLEAFLAVVHYGTVHAAASSIHLTQTAVTQRIKALEQRLKTTLFIRTRRGMELTPEGEALLRYCLTVQEFEGEALARIKGAGTETEIKVNIAGPSSIMSSRIIPQCVDVMKKYPNLLLHFDINDVENRDQSLRSGQCQLAIIPQEAIAKEMDYKKLEAERYVLVCSSKWKNRRLRDIISKEKIIDFDPTDQMTFNYLKHFKLFDIAKKERHFTNRVESIAMLISEELGYGVLTEEFAIPYVEQKILMILNEGKTYNNIPILAWYPRPEPPKYFTALIEAIK